MKKIPSFIFSVTLLTCYSLLGKTFDATRTETSSPPPLEGPMTTTKTWTNNNTESQKTITETRGGGTVSVQGSGGKGLTLTETEEYSTDGGTGMTTDFNGTTNNGENFSGTQVYTQTSGEGQEQTTIKGSQGGTFTYTNDYGGGNPAKTTSSGMSASGGTESGSSQTSSSNWDRSGQIEVTPGATTPNGTTDSKYGGNTYDIDYQTDNATQSITGTVTEE